MEDGRVRAARGERERERRGWIDRGARGERGEVEEIMREREKKEER